MKSYLSIIIPVYNAKRTLELLYLELNQVLKGLKYDYEIIMVDDGSKDNSFVILEDIRKRDDRVKIIKLANNAGQQNAILCGLQLAQGEVLITIDDDLQHPPHEIPKLIEKIDEGYDLVFGIPLDKKHPLFRNVGTRVIDLFFNMLGLKPSTLKISSFRAIKREVLQADLGDSEGFVYISALFLQGAKKPVNLLVSHEKRKYGRSNYNLRKLGGLLVQMFVRYYLFPNRNKKLSQPNYVIAKKIV
ncbi:MAG: glycosyltransferase [Firmicutes bacterium HGW-Firmicutes-12]|jgi:undecaprenyl-phosphate 4-deoxy-4-formamido-L-arabinose transferase|nr:MAG: glycosyltransferase [Firmicutes bacterium HGW-Firmicutes-12]